MEDADCDFLKQCAEMDSTGTVSASEQDQKGHRRRRSHLICHHSPDFYASALLGSRTPLL